MKSDWRSADDLDEVRKRFSRFEQRLETLEKCLVAGSGSPAGDQPPEVSVQGRRNALTAPAIQWKTSLAESTTIHGLKEVLTESHEYLRPVWLLIFICAMASSALFVHKVVREYMDDPTATKVKILRQNNYSYPVMLLCPDTWLDADKALAMNLSEAGLQYSLGFLMNFGIHKPPYVISNYNQAKSDFETWWYEGNGAKFETLADFFKHVAVDNDSFVVECSYCQDVSNPPPFAKIIMNEGVCYNLSLPVIDGRVSLSDLEYLHVKMPNQARGYLSSRSYWRFIIDPDLSLGMSDTHYLQVFVNHSNTIRVMPHHFKSLKNAYCVTMQEIQDSYYSQSACVANCVMTSRPNSCRPYPFIRSDMIPKNVTSVCNTAQWVAPDFQEAEVHQSREESEEKQIVETPTACIEQCPSLCDKWVFDSAVEAHKIEHQEAEVEGVTSFHFLNLVVHYGGILSHEEVPTYSFDTLVSNVGGQLGLWLGASLMSLIELAMFSLNMCCDKKRGKKRGSR